MALNMTCPHCKLEFEQRRKDQKYCCRRCKSVAHTYRKEIAKPRIRVYRPIILTIKEYRLLWDKQKGCCAICGKHESEFKRKLAIDHCHKTGKVRGLLCHSCNVGIGHLKDDVVLLRKAIDYISI